jgi:predicted phosphodiesterase
MKIQLLSDLHMEHSNYKLEVSPQADVLVLAGDIANFSNFQAYYDMLDSITIPIIAVMGNHEFYPDYRHEVGLYTMPQIKELLRKKFEAKPNFHLLDNECFTIGDFKFIGSTLWSGLKLNEATPEQLKREKMVIENSINDFKVVADFSIEKMLEENKKAEEFIFSEINSDYRNIVVTHFPPHKSCVHDRYKGNNLSILNSYFVNNIEDEKFKGIEAWLFGHTHTSFKLTVEDTKLYCNPRGYVSAFNVENKDFKDRLIIKL